VVPPKLTVEKTAHSISKTTFCLPITGKTVQTYKRQPSACGLGGNFIIGGFRMLSAYNIHSLKNFLPKYYCAPSTPILTWRQ